MDYCLAVLAIAVVGCRRIDHSIAALAIQSAVLGISLLLEAQGSGGAEHVVMGLLTLVVKGIAVPWLLMKALSGISVKPRPGLCLSMKISVTLAVFLSLLGYWLGRAFDIGDGLAPALSLMLVGFLVIATRAKTLSQVVGLMVVENGVALASSSLAGGLPLIVEMGVFFDVVVAVILMVFYSQRIASEFESLNTLHLTDLRG